MNPEGNPVDLEIKGSRMKTCPKSEMHLGTNDKELDKCNERSI